MEEDILKKKETEPKTKNNSILIIIIIVLLILLGVAGYFLFVKNNGEKKEEKVNINTDVLNYQCKEYLCGEEDYNSIKELLKTDDNVTYIYSDKNNKNHAIVLENVTNRNKYLYMVDKDKYYFKDDNYDFVSFIESGYDGSSVYDFNYAEVHQKNSNYYDSSNTKIYNFESGKFVFESGDYNDCTYAEYENTRFYKLRYNDKTELYDDEFNIVFVEKTYGDYAFDGKYIYGTMIENDKERFFKYSIVDKKYELSNVKCSDEICNDLRDTTYNYVVIYDNGEYKVYDFDGNLVFKPDEETNLKNIKRKDYTLPCMPDIYYSKNENKIKLIINPEPCGDSSCPPHFGYSYYEYDLGTKKTTYKFYTDSIPDEIYQNAISGYAEFE